MDRQEQFNKYFANNFWSIILYYNFKFDFHFLNVFVNILVFRGILTNVSKKVSIEYFETSFW